VTERARFEEAAIERWPPSWQNGLLSATMLMEQDRVHYEISVKIHPQQSVRNQKSVEKSDRAVNLI